MIIMYVFRSVPRSGSDLRIKEKKKGIHYYWSGLTDWNCGPWGYDSTLSAIELVQPVCCTQTCPLPISSHALVSFYSFQSSCSAWFQGCHSSRHRTQRKSYHSFETLDSSPNIISLDDNCPLALARGSSRISWHLWALFHTLEQTLKHVSCDKFKFFVYVLTNWLAINK